MNGETPKNKYISLAEATKYCNYSLPYLNLRIRQGKLKAVKFGRNWMTKKEWLMDYLTRVEAYNNSNQTNHFEKEEIPPTGVSEKSVFGDEEKGLSSIPPAGVFQATQKIKKISFARIGYVSLIIMSLFIGSILLIEFGIGNDSQNFSGKTIETISNFSKTISGKTKILFASLEQKDNSGILKSSFGFLGKGFQKISLSLKSMFDFFKDGIALINKSYGKTAEGLIAFPATYNEDLKKKVQKLFSDEIRIGPIDKSSGHVIPVFKESDGDKYMYMLVPINN
jgi:hypothetical protein